MVSLFTLIFFIFGACRLGWLVPCGLCGIVIAFFVVWHLLSVLIALVSFHAYHFPVRFLDR